MKRSFISRTSVFVAIALLAGFGAIGCKKAGGPASGLSTKNNVVWWQLSDIQRLNPFTSTDNNASYVQGEIWESLNFANPFTQELLPGMASLPEVSADHLTYTYTMNPACHWSDGKPCTSDDVIFSFKTVMNQKLLNTQQLRNYFNDFDSAYCPNGDKSKIAFHLSKPYFQADILLGGGYVKILPKHILDPKNLTDKFTFQELKSNAKNPAIQEFATWFESPELARDPKYQIGTGAYVFQGWVTNDRLILKLDSNYWAKNVRWQEAYPEELIFKTINDQNAALTALKAKDVDINDGLKPDQYLTQLDTTTNKAIRKDTVYWNAYSFIAWNDARPLFQDKQVRKALTALINRDEILHAILKDQGKKVEGPVIFTQPNYDPTVKQQQYDPEAAKKMLADAGWTDSDGDGVLDKVINGKRTPFKFTFLVNAGNDVRKQILLVIAEELRKAGIDAGVSALEWSVYLENTQTHNYDACYGAWAGNASEDDNYQLWHSSQAANKGSNYYSFKNADADHLLEQIRTEFDKSKRMEMSKQFQHIVADEQPVSFLFASPLFIGIVNRFDNLAFFHQRPCFDPRYWMVRGANVKRAPNAVPMEANGPVASTDH